jgi:hypothetical protein
MYLVAFLLKELFEVVKEELLLPSKNIYQDKLPLIPFGFILSHFVRAGLSN